MDKPGPEKRTQWAVRNRLRSRMPKFVLYHTYVSINNTVSQNLVEFSSQGRTKAGAAALNRAAVEGIYAMAARDVFRLRNQPQFSRDIQVSCSFFEIYGSNVFDLLSDKQKLRVLEDGRQQVPCLLFNFS